MIKNAYRSFLIPALISLGMMLPVLHVHFDEITGTRIDNQSATDHEFCAICNFTGKADAAGSSEALNIDPPERHVIVTKGEPCTESHSNNANLRAPPHTV